MLEKIGGDLAGGQNVSAITDMMLRVMARQADYKSGDIIVVRDGRVTLGDGFDRRFWDAEDRCARQALERR